jgi:tetratricopeptide (TPR) repeat protein
MSKTLKTLFLASLLLCSLAQGQSPEINFASLKKSIDEEVSKISNESQDKKTERLFYLYLLAARESKMAGNTKVALEFYEEILKSFPSYKEQKLEAVLNSISILMNENKKAEARGILEKYKDLSFQNDPNLKEQKIKRKELDQYFEAIELILNDKSPSAEQRENNSAISNYFGHLFYDIEMRTLIKEKKFSEALLQMNPDGIMFSTIVQKTTYDLLNILVNKKSVKKLLCEDTYKNYPKAFSYSMKICASLIKYRDGKWIGATRSADLHDLKVYFSKRNQDMSYLYDALNELEASVP